MYGVSYRVKTTTTTYWCFSKSKVSAGTVFPPQFSITVPSKPVFASNPSLCNCTRVNWLKKVRKRYIFFCNIPISSNWASFYIYGRQFEHLTNMIKISFCLVGVPIHTFLMVLATNNWDNLLFYCLKLLINACLMWLIAVRF